MDTFQANAETTKEKSLILSQLPHSPGVYIYRNSEGIILYIGKAIDIFNRVHQYFSPSNLPPKTAILVGQIADIQIIQTLSEFDALLLEAKLIYKHQPKYNILAKDDKSPIYVKLTISEDLPRILYIRKPRQPSYGEFNDKGDVVFGPFQSAKTIRSIMRSLRHIIPYCTQVKRNGRACFYTQIGLCNPCPSLINGMEESKEKQQYVVQYRKNIFRLRDVLSGKTSLVITELEKEMKRNADNKEFEHAAHIRNQVSALYELISKRYDPMLYTKDAMIEDIAENEMQSLKRILVRVYPEVTSLERIECIDISNTSGVHPTGSLVVLSHGLVNTSEYKRFKIRQPNGPNDVGMIEEVIRRRFSHTEWTLPNVFIVDGGKPQVSRATKVFSELHIGIPLIGLAKRQEEIIVMKNNELKIFRLPMTDPAIHILQRIRDEAHRFAIGYHKKLRADSFLQKS
jgi:excinuclease ABC subunit C